MPQPVTSVTGLAMTWVFPRSYYENCNHLYRACSGNPGPGGWGAILEWNGVEKEISGGAPDTTNNRMELTGVIEALSLLKEPCIVELYSDSKYVIDALEKGWVYGWKKKGQKRQEARPERGSLGAAAAPHRPARCPLSLGQRPRLQRQEQPLR